MTKDALIITIQNFPFFTTSNIQNTIGINALKLKPEEQFVNRNIFLVIPGFLIKIIFKKKVHASWRSLPVCSLKSRSTQVYNKTSG